MPRLLIATNNPGKLAEFRRLLDGCGWELVTPADLGLDLPDEEPGDSYEENASIKATNGTAASGLVALGDDSGLEIEALDGAPGPRSARFLGGGASYDDRFARILAQLDGLPSDRRAARFRCVIAVARPWSEELKLCPGEVHGLIALEPSGDLGFGYDPIFYVPAMARTLAQLPPGDKDAISHRGQAAMRARAVLRELLHEYGKRDPAISANTGLET